MEGGGGGINLPNYPFPLHNRSTAPPLAARFLIDESTTEDSNKMKSGFGDFLPSCGGDDEIIGVSSSWILPCLHLHLNHDVPIISNNSISPKSLKRGRAGSSSAALVKRKWVEEEDR